MSVPDCKMKPKRYLRRRRLSFLIVMALKVIYGFLIIFTLPKLGTTREFNIIYLKKKVYRLLSL